MSVALKLSKKDLESNDTKLLDKQLFLTYRKLRIVP